MSDSTRPATDETSGSSSGADPTQRRNRTQMIVIMLVALFTLGGSYAMFYAAKNSAGWGTTNNGTFVAPATNIEQFGWQVPGELHRWWLWTVVQDCTAQCETSVQQMRALHILLNREAERVRRGFTLAQTSPAPDWLVQYPELARITVTDRTGLGDGIYIVDPNGNVVLFYPLDVNPEAVLQDLKKLLKVSQIG
jgi:cytochrome oxidase Cu insertion factor (SCO1/SenC/PrrC family)